jgi:uncharacterized protein DUF559/putative AbiEi antitoxin of type IV toxin-antitoxin system
MLPSAGGGRVSGGEGIFGAVGGAAARLAARGCVGPRASLLPLRRVGAIPGLVRRFGRAGARDGPRGRRYVRYPDVSGHTLFELASLTGGGPRRSVVAGATESWCDRRVSCCDSVAMLVAMDPVVAATSAIRTPHAALPPDRRIADLATAQHGVVARDQLRGLGLSETAIARRLAAGRLHRVHRSVYAVGHPILGSRGRWTAALLAGGKDAVLSHAAAGALWAIRASDAELIDITVPRGGRRQLSGVRVHRARALRTDEVTVRDGIRVTSAARTILDLAPTLTERALERLLDQAELERATDVRALEAMLVANHGHRGCGPLRRVLDAHVPGTTVTASPLEERMLALCRAHGLPRPLVNHHVEGVEVDFVFAEHRVLVEADGWRYHRSRAAFERDRERDALFARAGYRVLRVTDRQMKREPATVAATNAALLDVKTE